MRTFIIIHEFISMKINLLVNQRRWHNNGSTTVETGVEGGGRGR